MKRFIILIALTTLTIAACKKENNTAPTAKTTADSSDVAKYTWRLNKTWAMVGSYMIYENPSGPGGKDTTYQGPVNVRYETISVLNDSTIYFEPTDNARKTSQAELGFYQMDTNEGYLEYIPVFFLNGQRYRPTFLKYYYIKDSISYYFANPGTNSSSFLWLNTQ